jgi:internalin A
VLRLRFAKITDAGLAQLNHLTTITHLDLSGTQVTDAALLRLKGLSNLSSLGLSFTQVTDAGEKELKRTMPSLTIYR